jgi:hypothetical protein
MVDFEQSPEPFLSRLMARRWPWFLAGFLTAWLIALWVVWFFGPRLKVTAVDPLTGRLKYTDTLLGVTLVERVDENDVSKWAEQHSILGIYAGQYGWTQVSGEGREWFSGTMIGCGGYNVPALIHGRNLTIDGLTPEQTLQKYQTELVAYFREHGSTNGVESRWSKIVKGK